MIYSGTAHKCIPFTLRCPRSHRSLLPAARPHPFYDHLTLFAAPTSTSSHVTAKQLEPIGYEKNRRTGANARTMQNSVNKPK